MKHAPTLLGALGAMVLAAPAVAQLYGIDIVNTNRLLTINPDTAASTIIGPVGPITPLNGLAYDPHTDTMYAVRPGVSGGLFRVDRQSGAATLIGPFGNFPNVNGLAFDPVGKILYATDNATNSLLTLDPSTGAATRIAGIGGGFTEIEGLGFDAVTGTLFGLTQLQRRVVRINPTTGLATQLPTELPSATWRGLEFDQKHNVLFATASTTLYRIDPVSGSATEVGVISGVGAVQGLAAVPPPATSALALLGAANLMHRRRRGTRSNPAVPHTAGECPPGRS